jgi:hypothetical protein
MCGRCPAPAELSVIPEDALTAARDSNALRRPPADTDGELETYPDLDCGDMSPLFLRLDGDRRRPTMCESVLRQASVKE